jgi:DNA-binding IclR family transcriptional regulator
MGKVILAFSSEDAESTVRSLGELERFTANTQTAVTDLTADLIQIRERGWSRNHGERYEGVVGIAAPVFDASGKFVAAVGIQGPEVRVDQEVAVAAVLKASENLKGRLRAG